MSLLQEPRVPKWKMGLTVPIPIPKRERSWIDPAVQASKRAKSSPTAIQTMIHGVLVSHEGVECTNVAPCTNVTNWPVTGEININSLHSSLDAISVGGATVSWCICKGQLTTTVNAFGTAPEPIEPQDVEILSLQVDAALEAVNKQVTYPAVDARRCAFALVTSVFMAEMTECDDGKAAPISIRPPPDDASMCVITVNDVGRLKSTAAVLVLNHVVGAHMILNATTFKLIIRIEKL
jgi:hypothetical protein